MSSLQYNTYVIRVREAFRPYVDYLRSEKRRFLLLVGVIPAFIVVPNFLAAPSELQSMIGLYIQMAISGALGAILFVGAFLVRAIGYKDAASFRDGAILFAVLIAMIIAQIRMTKLRNPYFTGALFFVWAVVGIVAGFLLLGR